MDGNEKGGGPIMKELLKKYGLNMKEASDLLHIPYRTIQNWVGGTRKCPKYIIELIDFRLKFLSASTEETQSDPQPNTKIAQTRN